MTRKNAIKAVLSVPGDKSISHRALIFSALCKGTVRIQGLSPAEDCQSTAECLEKLGLTIKRVPPTPEFPALHEAIVESPGFKNLHEPKTVLYAGNSGTTMRVLSGLVAGRPFTTRFDGDASLRQRPMSRILMPMYEMGAQIHYEFEKDMAPVADCAPFAIIGGNLKGKDFTLKVASAQVQTAIMLAGLQAAGTTSIKMPVPSTVRDHTERMFKHMQVPFKTDGNGYVEVEAMTEPVGPFNITVPGDISSAAFFMVAAACLPDSDLLLKNVGLNPGRTLIIDVLKQMGADISLESQQEIGGEPIADIRVRYAGRLKGATISGESVASGIDEIPILALAGATCDGTFSVAGAGELRHKESDRLKAITENMKALGLNVEESPDGFSIQGVEKISGNSFWRTYNDHRLAMTGLIANAICREPLQIEETDSIKISYPKFRDNLNLLLS